MGQGVSLKLKGKRYFCILLCVYVYLYICVFVYLWFSRALTTSVHIATVLFFAASVHCLENLGAVQNFALCFQWLGLQLFLLLIHNR